MSSVNPAIAEQPTPNGVGGPSIQSLVRDDLHQREKLGIERYGEPLQANNGRSGVIDAYQEVLDLACYLRQVIAEGGLVGRHGADDSSSDPHVSMTPGKLLALVLDSDEQGRLELCRRLLQAKETEYRCVLFEHERKISDLEQRVGELSRSLIRCAGGKVPSPDVLALARSHPFSSEVT